MAFKGKMDVLQMMVLLRKWKTSKKSFIHLSKTLHKGQSKLSISVCKDNKIQYGDVLTLQDPNQEIQQLIPTMQLTEGSPPQLKERLLSNKHAIPINQNQI